MNILGIGCAFEHDPSAALLRDGEVVAAAEEERFIRSKHALDQAPTRAIRYCLEAGGIGPEEVDIVAFPWSPAAYRERMWRFFRRVYATKPDHAFKAVYKARDRRRRKIGKLHRALASAGMDPRKVRIELVEHHLAHASSAYHLSGFEDAALLSVDGKGEFTSTLLGVGERGAMRTIHEVLNPDSLGLFYSCMTDYLGFDVNDGEYKVMGMAPFGDPSKIDLSPFVTWDAEGNYRVDERRVWVPKSKRWQGRRFSQEMVEMLGPPREGDGLAEPYTHIAAATQRLLEDVVLALVKARLGEALERTRSLCFAGGCALNVSLNRRLLELPQVERLFVQPAAGDSGTSLGAATFVAQQLGLKVKPLRHVYLGPSFDGREVRAALERFKIPYRVLEDRVATGARLLADGKAVAWFQGRMEWGPRALGNRSILGHPGIKGMADDINERIKFREPWRPFCPSILDAHAEELLGTKHPSPYMTFSFKVTGAARRLIPEAVHVDGTARPQVVTEEANPTYYRLIRAFKELTGIPAVLNTSLNRRGEPMICSPEDAIAMFFGSGIEHLIIEDCHVEK